MQTTTENSIEIQKTERDVEQRKFQIETIDYKGRNIIVFSMEHDKQYLKSEYSAKPKLIPPDWEDQVREQLENSSMLFVEYFVPDILNQLTGILPIDAFIKNYTQQHIEPVYGKLESI